MKVLVFPHHLELGGSQTNAIELAAAARDNHGHEVTVFATPGPAVSLVQRHGLRYVPAPRPSGHPSARVMRALRDTVRDDRPDLVHAWDWPQMLDAFYSVHLRDRVPMLGSNMSMAVSYLPRSFPITYGTEELVAAARDSRHGRVELLEPPVDTDLNAPDAVDPAPLRAERRLDASALTLVIVSRLVEWMKLEGVERAIDAVVRLDPTTRLQLVVVGGGTAEERVRTRAAEVNGQLGRNAVVLTGPLVDPRPAYAAADVVLGMGGSILRGMAFAKPCIVLGERGFSEILTPHTSAGFLWRGFYGLGDGDPSGDRLVEQVRSLAEPGRRDELGAFSRARVLERFSVRAGAATLDRLYSEVAAERRSRVGALLDGGRAGTRRVAAAGLGAARRTATAARRSLRH